VKDIFGLKVENERRLQQLRTALMEALENPDEPAGEPVAVPKRRKAAAGG